MTFSKLHTMTSLELFLRFEFLCQFFCGIFVNFFEKDNKKIFSDFSRKRVRLELARQANAALFRWIKSEFAN